MELTREEGRDIVCGDHEDWCQVEGTRRIVGLLRWSITVWGVFKHKPSGKHYSLEWREAATEQQTEQPFEYTDPAPAEVERVERTIQVWDRVE